MILMASSRGTGRLRKMLTLPWTKLSMISFLPVMVFVKTENIDDVAVRELERLRFIGGNRRRAGNGRRRGGIRLRLRGRNGGGRFFRRRRCCSRCFRRGRGRGRRNLGNARGKRTRTYGGGARRLRLLPENGSQRCETQRHKTEWAKHALYVIGQGALVKIIGSIPVEVGGAGENHPVICIHGRLKGRTSNAQRPTFNVQ